MSTRTVARRVKGNSHGLINGMFSPGDLGRLLKPFVFLDFLHGNVKPSGMNFGFHPHSGIGTLTYSLTAPVHYVDTEGISGVLQPGGLEWMQAGGGAWHKSSFKGSSEGLLAFQFWLALPPVVEEGPSHSEYIAPSEVPSRNNIKVLLGEYEGLVSPIKTPTSVNLLDVTLATAGEVFTYKYPSGHASSFVMVYQGSAIVGDEHRPATNEEVIVISHDESESGYFVIKATTGGVRCIVASAVPHDHPLSLGMYSVHTNAASLARSEMRIEELGNKISRNDEL